MAYFESKQTVYKPRPIPTEPSYNPPTPPTPPSVEGGSEPVNPRPTFTGECDITFYNNKSENEKVEKELSNAITFNISLKNDTSILTPTILIETNTDLTKHNYAKMLDRYYYIDDIELMVGNIYSISMRVDVLMTYKDDLKKQRAIIDKQSVRNNKYINDGSYVVQSDEITRVINFSNGFNDNGTHILITAGG